MSSYSDTPARSAEPAFLSDTDPDYRKLEERQGLLRDSTPWRVAGFQGAEQIHSSLRELYCDNAFEFSGGPTSMEHMKQALIVEFSKPFPTRYEAPEFYLLLVWEDLLIRNFLATTDPRSDLKLTQRPLVGTLPSMSLNACTIKTTGSSKTLIAVNWGVYVVLISMVELALETVKIEIDPSGKTFSIFGNEEEFRQRLHAMPQMKEQLIHLLLFYYGGEKVDPNACSSKSSKALFWFGSISRAMGLFVLAHEYGHVLANHDSEMAINSSGHGSETLVHSWAQELEADIIGHNLMSYVLERAASEVPRQNVLLGFHLVAPLFYFICVRIVEEAEYIVQHGGELPSGPSLLEISEARNTLDFAFKHLLDGRWKEPSVVSALSRYSDHPPGWLRWESAQIYFEREFRDLKQHGFTGVGIALASNMQELWEETMPEFARIVKEHAR